MDYNEYLKQNPDFSKKVSNNSLSSWVVIKLLLASISAFLLAAGVSACAIINIGSILYFILMLIAGILFLMSIAYIISAGVYIGIHSK